MSQIRQPTNIARITAPGHGTCSRSGLEFDITPNYLLYAQASHDSHLLKDHIGFTRLPKFGSHHHARVQELATTRIQFHKDNDESVIAYQLDETQNLLAIATLKQDTIIVRNLDFEFLPRFHTGARQSEFFIPVSGELASCQIQIFGGHLLVLIVQASFSELHIFGWKLTHHDARHRAPRNTMTSVSFVGANSLVTTNADTLCADIWSIQSHKLIKTASLQLPPINGRAHLEALSCTFLSPEHASWEDTRVDLTTTFNLLIANHSGSGFASVKFVVNRSQLWAFANPARIIGAVAWGHWANVRCFDDAFNKDNCNIAGPHFTAMSDIDTKIPNLVSIFQFSAGQSSSIEPFKPRFTTGRSDPFQWPLVSNLDTRLVHQSQIPCSRVLVHDRRILAIEDNPHYTIIRVYPY